MITNTITLALRHLAKHRLYAFINIAGLALGLSVFLFSTLLTSYENNHDHMFAQRGHIFTVGSIFSPTSEEPISEYANARLALAPILKREIKPAQQVVRSLLRERVLSVGEGTSGGTSGGTSEGISEGISYESIRFVDPGFTQIFDFNYLQGDAKAIEDPYALVITATTAQRLFGRIDVLGEKVSLNHQRDMVIGAVIEDVAADSHFNASFIPNSTLTVFTSVQVLVDIDGFNPLGEWTSLNPADMTYILLPERLDLPWLQAQVDDIYPRYVPAKELEYISALKVRPLVEANIMVWDALGFPVLGTVQLLGLLVLLVACVNYANLATAQSFGRTREIGLRKTFGAERWQLLLQFLLESLILAAFAMLLALACIELCVPAYNSWTGKAVTLAYGHFLPWLLLTTLIMGLLAGIYPALLISRYNSIDTLQSSFLNSRRGLTFRNVMIAAQFSISMFILAMVMIIYFQNENIKGLANQFPKSQLVVLSRIGLESIQPKHQQLRRSLSALPGVAAVTFSSAIPFVQSGEVHQVSALKGGKEGFKVIMVSVDAEFMRAYDIELLGGRALGLTEDSGEAIQVVINQMAAQRLGYGGSDAIGKRFYQLPVDQTINKKEAQLPQYQIVGLMPDQYFRGVHTKIRPLVFLTEPKSYNFISIRLADDLSDKLNDQTLTAIDEVWAQVIKDYPIRRASLDYYFNFFYRIPQMISDVIAIFAAVALSLALIGLYGLTAFMAQRRRKEIALRKIMGATERQIIGLLIWQFSKPVMWSLLVAMPLAYLASGIYLDFYAERIRFVVPVILLASSVTLLTAWGIVAGHAISIARATPMRSLRS
ncbi:MAG: putative ABC transport system permease protein [Phenylobacterium sp.]|jgi:putative ABC transport system permease protein